MGKLLLIVVLGAGAIFSIASLNMNQSNTLMVSNAVSDYEAVQAKNYAASGIDYAINKLSQDTSWSGTTNKALQEGKITVSVQNTSAKYYNGPNTGLTKGKLITSIGNWGNTNDTIRAVVQLPSGSQPLSNNAPPFFKYALASDGNLNLSGSVTVRDDNNPTVNANIHTNGNFNMNGNNTVKGFLSYVGNAQSNPAHRMNTAISPNFNPENKPNRSQTPPITMPTFKAEDYKSQATELHNSDKTFSGTTTLGTKTSPKIIYVNGNVTIKGTIIGYGIIVCTGNVIANGNVTVTGQDPTGNNVGIYTNGNVEVSGNVTLRAQVYANGNIKMGGNSKVYGSMTTKGNFEFHGNFSMFYRPVTTELTNPIWPDNSGNGITSSSRPTIVSYFE